MFGNIRGADLDSVLVYKSVYGFHYDDLPEQDYYDPTASEVAKKHHQTFNTLLKVTELLPIVSILASVGHFYAAFRIAQLPGSVSHKIANCGLHALRGVVGLAGFGLVNVIVDSILFNPETNCVKSRFLPGLQTPKHSPGELFNFQSLQ